MTLGSYSHYGKPAMHTGLWGLLFEGRIGMPPGVVERILI